MEELENIIALIGLIALVATTALLGVAAYALRLAASATAAAGQFTTIVFIALAAGAMS